MPDAATVKLVFAPEQIVPAEGWVLIVVVMFTVRLAALLVAAGEQGPLIITRYWYPVMETVGAVK